LFIFMDLDLYQNIDEKAKAIIKETAPLKKEEKAIDFGDLIEKPLFLDEAQPLNKTKDYLNAATGWVYACASVICDEVAAIDLHLYKKTNKGIEEQLSHPILDLLYRANDFTTKFDLFWLTQQYLELSGEAPWYLVKQGGKITDILLLRPDLIDVIPGKDTYIDGYKYRVNQGKTIQLEGEDVLFLKVPDNTRPFRGRGTLQAIVKTVDIDNFSEDFNRNFFYNSAMPGSILKTDQKLTQETKKYLEFHIKRLYKGIDNAHKAMILEQGLDWKPMQMSQKDMDFLEQQRFSRDKILGIFRVPRTALGITDDVNRANAEATDYVFAKRTIKPKMQRLIEQLNEFLLPQFPDSENLFLSFTDPVPENLDNKLNYYKTGLSSGFLTINEVRKEENLEGIGPEGDQIFIPFTVNPIGQIKEQKQIDGLIQKQLSARNRKTNEKQSNKERIEKTLTEKLTPIVKQLLGRTLKKQGKKKSAETDKDINQKFWEAKIFKTDSFEKKWIEKMDEIFNDQSAKVLNIMPEKAASDDIKKWLLDKKKETKKTQKTFKPLMGSIIKEGGKDGFILLGLDDDLDLSNPIVQNFLEERSFQFSEEITEETNDKLGKTLSDGVANGESIPQLRKRVETIFDEMKKYRSERIARSEVIRASNYGTEQAYKESGVVEAKIWLTAFDERTCEYCADMDGKTVDLDENFADKGDTIAGFAVDYEDVGAPPLHPNCRCTIIPKVKS